MKRTAVLPAWVGHEARLTAPQNRLSPGVVEDDPAVAPELGRGSRVGTIDRQCLHRMDWLQMTGTSTGIAMGLPHRAILRTRIAIT